MWIRDRGSTDEVEAKAYTIANQKEFKKGERAFLTDSVLIRRCVEETGTGASAFTVGIAVSEVSDKPAFLYEYAE